LLDVWDQYLVRAVSAQTILTPKHPDLAAVQRTMFEDHRRILHALRSHNSKAAERAVRDHISAALARLLKIIQRG
jgi:DNA-binding FadR family transcriptional regulator